MWKEYQPYADSNFLSKARDHDFQASFWELYLGCSLLRQDMQIEPRAERSRLWGSSDKGPDFRIVAPYRIWIEAVAPSSGITDYAIPEAELGVVCRVPDDEAKYRFLYIIRKKAQRWRSYIKKGLVNPSDCYVVAVNTGKIPPVPDLDPPRIVRAMLGLGFPEVSMDLNSGTLSNWVFQSQDRIFNLSHKSVSKGISAILSSEITPFNSCEPWFDHSSFVIGDDYCIVHTPRATNRLPSGFLKLGQAYWPDDAGVWKVSRWFKDRARRDETT
jgi:hypothetical protein